MCWVDIDYADADRPVRAPPGRPRPPAGRPRQPLRRAGRRRLRPGHRALAGFSAAVAERGPDRRRRLLRRRRAAGEACVEQLLPSIRRSPRWPPSTRRRCPASSARSHGAGLAVPRDFSVTGVAAQHWAEDFRPPLTAADVPTREMGAEAVTLLLELIATPGRPTPAPLLRAAHLAAFQHRPGPGPLTRSRPPAGPAVPVAGRNGRHTGCRTPPRRDPALAGPAQGSRVAPRRTRRRCPACLLGGGEDEVAAGGPGVGAVAQARRRSGRRSSRRSRTSRTGRGTGR